MNSDILTHIIDLKMEAEDVNNRINGAVYTARDTGKSWAAIGEALGMSKQAAQQKYNKVGKPHPLYTPEIEAPDVAGTSVTPSIFLEPDVPAKPKPSRKVATRKPPATSTHGGFRREYVLPGDRIEHAQQGTGKGPQFCPKCGSNNHKGNDWHTVSIMDGCTPTKYDPQNITDYMNARAK